MITRYEALQAQADALTQAIGEQSDQTMLAQLQAALERTQQKMQSMSVEEASEPLDSRSVQLGRAW